MGSLLSISKKALRKIGVAEIQSLSQGGPAATSCVQAVEECVKQVLREHPWGFAAVWATLPQLVADPPFGYTYAYQAPNEVINIFDIRTSDDLRAPKEEFEKVSGNVVYTDATPCYARYTVYVEADLLRAPPDFINTCSWLLASEIAPSLAKMSLVEGLLQGYYRTLAQAMAADARGTKVRGEDRSSSNHILRERGYPSQYDTEEWS